MATYTDNGTNTPNGSHKVFTYTFPALQTEDIKVALNGLVQATTKYTSSLSPAQIEFNNTNIDSSVQENTGAPKTGVVVRVFRETTVGKTSGDDDPKAVFAAGSSIRAADLNANTEQALYAIAELRDQPKFSTQINTGAVTSAKIEDGTIVNADVNASAAIEGSKLQASSGSNSGTMSSANFTKLAGIATGAEVNVNADWNSSSGDSQILNKPSLVTGINDLSDVNTIGVANGKILKYDSGSSSFVIADDSGGSGGSSTFAGLTDTPTNYTGAAGKTLKVNSSGNAIEYVTVTGSDVVDDTTPQLGGALDTNSEDIIFNTTGGTQTEKARWSASQDAFNLRDGTTIKFGDHTQSGATVGDVSMAYINGQDFHFQGSYNGSGDIVIGHSNSSGNTIPVIKAVRGSGAGGGGSAELWWNDPTAGTSGARQLATSADGLHCDAEVHCQAGLNTEGDVVFNSGTTNMNILWDASDKTLEFADNVKIGFGADGNDFEIYHDATDNIIQAFGSPKIKLRHSAADGSNVKDALVSYVDSQVELYHNNVKKFETSSAGATVTGTCTATAFSGDGSALTGIAAGATGGGTDEIFWENGQTVTTNYTITNNKNAMSAGPITINNGIAVTIGTGENWTIV